jgi:uncharacterized protein
VRPEKREAVTALSFGRIDLPATTAFIAVLALVVIAFPATAALFASRIRNADDRPRAKHLRYARTILVLWTVSAIAYYALRLHHIGVAAVGVRPPNYAIAYFVGPLTTLVWLSIGGSFRRQGLRPDYAQAIRAVVPTRTSDWFWFVPVAASAALCEEFLYRGFALTEIGQLSGSIAIGIIVSSIAFGLAHAYQGRAGMAAVTVVGLIYSGLYVNFDSLAPCVLAHFLQDIGGAFFTAQALRRASLSGVGGATAAGEYRQPSR